jgi:hypothetical protein
MDGITRCSMNFFQGRLDRTLDRQLAESVFIDGRLCQLILEGQKRKKRPLRGRGIAQRA